MEIISWSDFERVELRAGTIIAVVKQIGPMKSEFLVCGFYRESGEAVSGRAGTVGS